MQNFDRYKFGLGLVLITTLILGGGFYAVYLAQQQEQRGKWVIHTHEILNRLDALANHITAAKTEGLGYLLAGQGDLLQTYNATLRLVGGDLNQIQTLTLDNKIQQKRTADLRRLIDLKIAALTASIDLMQNQKLDELREPVTEISRRSGIQEILDLISEMQQEEKALLNSRIEKWRSLALQTRASILIGTAVLYLLSLALYTMLFREFTRQRLIAETERHSASHERGEAARLREIVKIQHEISGHSLDLYSAMQIIAQRIQTMTVAEGAIVEMVEGGEMVYRAASGTGAPHIGLRIKAVGSLSGLCVETNNVLKCDDSEIDGRVDKQACKRVGLRSMVVVPLRHKGQAVGVIKSMSSRVAAFNNDHVAALELMAGMLSATISDATAAAALGRLNQELANANDELAAQRDSLEKLNDQLEILASTDGLTGLKNFRTLQSRLQEECERALRFKTPMSFVLLDVDHFKQFNDQFGHPAGDAVLRRVAELLQLTARAIDCVARYGGEEFAVLLPQTDADGAQIIAERLRAAIADAAWLQRSITVSVGVSSTDNQTCSPTTLLAAADKALYLSKSSGRNRVTFCG